MNAGLFSGRATYSWTKSRVIGVTPRYQSRLIGTQYQVGRSPDYVPEHVWGVQASYATGANLISFNINGTGLLYTGSTELTLITLSSVPRLPGFTPRIGLPSDYRAIGAGYTTVDLNASHRFSHRIEGVLQVQNLGNYYRNDYGAQFSAIGRQSKAGFRMKL